MKKRIVTPFSLAFLDIMFCGFGAVVLLVMILNGEVLKKREAQSEDLRGELSRATVLEQLARENLTMVREKVEAATLEQGGLRAAIGDREAERLNAERSRAETLRKLRETEREQARLEAERDALRKSAELIRAKPPEDPKTGTRKIGFSGDGERQYLNRTEAGRQADAGPARRVVQHAGRDDREYRPPQTDAAGSPCRSAEMAAGGARRTLAGGQFSTGFPLSGLCLQHDGPSRWWATAAVAG